MLRFVSNSEWKYPNMALDTRRDAQAVEHESVVQQGTYNQTLSEEDCLVVFDFAGHRPREPVALGASLKDRPRRCWSMIVGLQLFLRTPSVLS